MEHTTEEKPIVTATFKGSFESLALSALEEAGIPLTADSLPAALKDPKLAPTIDTVILSFRNTLRSSGIEVIITQPTGLHEETPLPDNVLPFPQKRIKKTSSKPDSEPDQVLRFSSKVEKEIAAAKRAVRAMKRLSGGLPN